MAICQYASKPCPNQRSMKVNGQLHRLCDFHRERANAAQRRWHKRQRNDSSSEDAEPQSPSPANGARKRARTLVSAKMKVKLEHANTNALAVPMYENLLRADTPFVKLLAPAVAMNSIDAPMVFANDEEFLNEMVFDVARATSYSEFLPPFDLSFKLSDMDFAQQQPLDAYSMIV